MRYLVIRIGPYSTKPLKTCGAREGQGGAAEDQAQQRLGEQREREGQDQAEQRLLAIEPAHKHHLDDDADERR